MTDISEADEREAREWLEYNSHPNADFLVAKHARTILSLLDRPRMPKPEDVPDNVCAAMFWAGSSVATPDMPVIARGRHVYQAMYDILTAPPAPAKVEAWAIKSANGELDGTFVQKSDAERYLQRSSGSRIVRLVEADHE